ncbi:MAG: DUF2807 domain-containing protein [Bacteroidota bacterium]
MNRKLLFSALACSLLFCFYSCGPGSISTVQYPYSGFDHIVLRAPLHLTLTQDNSFAVELDADSLYLPWFEIDMIGTTLYVDWAPDTTGFGAQDTIPFYDIDLTVHLPDLKKLDVHTFAKVETSNQLQVNDLDIDIIGAADLALDAVGNDVQLDIKGGAEVEVILDANQFAAEVKGVEYLKASGTVDSERFEIKGAGKIEAFDLLATHCEIEFAGAGDAEITADSTLDVRIIGGGVIYYKGFPAIDQQILGVGRLINAN